jgi:hypothetical protein
MFSITRSMLLSDPASRRRPCASLSLHLHQVVKRTFTFKLSIMLGTPKKRPLERVAYKVLTEERNMHFSCFRTQPQCR